MPVAPAAAIETKGFPCLGRLRMQSDQSCAVQGQLHGQSRGGARNNGSRFRPTREARMVAPCSDWPLGRSAVAVMLSNPAAASCFLSGQQTQLHRHLAPACGRERKRHDLRPRRCPAGTKSAGVSWRVARGSSQHEKLDSELCAIPVERLTDGGGAHGDAPAGGLESSLATLVSSHPGYNAQACAGSASRHCGRCQQLPRLRWSCCALLREGLMPWCKQ